MRFFILFAAFLLSFSAQANRNIMLTGFWYPTNEMLRPFSANPRINPGTWVGKNWNNSGYNIYAFFPEFQGSDKVGTGEFSVDFASAFNDFMRITKELKPVAIISFGKGNGPWEIENRFPAYYESMFRSGNIPSVIGARVKYEVPESLKTPQPNFSSLPKSAIRDAVNSNTLPYLHAWVEPESSNAGNFLCGFIGYLGSWYHNEHLNPSDSAYNRFSGFIHVNGELERSRVSLNSTLTALITELNK